MVHAIHRKFYILAHCNAMLGCCRKCWWLTASHM